MAMTDFLENALINHIFRDTAYSQPTIHIGLFTAAPTDTGGGTEVSGGSYARQSVDGNANWDAPSLGSSSNTNDVTFPTATADWGTVTHVGVFDALSGGNLLFYAALVQSKVVNNGDTFKFVAGNLDLTLD